MNLIGSFGLCHHIHDKPTQALNANLNDKDRSVLLICTDTLALGLVLGNYKLDKKTQEPIVI